jgi:hypothetical protein
MSQFMNDWHWKLRRPNLIEERPVPPPVFLSFEDWLDLTTEGERAAWCREKAKTANKRWSDIPPEMRVTTEQVMALLLAARGCCVFCGSLAVELRPVNPATGKRDGPWAQVGRRIGTLEHVNNQPHVLAWCCKWCNTWGDRYPEVRRFGLADHAGYYPQSGKMSGPAERRAYARAKATEKKAALDRKQQRQQEAEEAELAAEWDEYDDPALYEWPYLHSDAPR